MYVEAFLKMSSNCRQCIISCCFLVNVFQYLRVSNFLDLCCLLLQQLDMRGHRNKKIKHLQLNVGSCCNPSMTELKQEGYTLDLIRRFCLRSKKKKKTHFIATPVVFKSSICQCVGYSSPFLLGIFLEQQSATGGTVIKRSTRSCYQLRAWQNALNAVFLLAQILHTFISTCQTIIRSLIYCYI